jgi:hypothetical protein
LIGASAEALKGWRIDDRRVQGRRLRQSRKSDCSAVHRLADPQRSTATLPAIPSPSFQSAERCRLRQKRHGGWHWQVPRRRRRWRLKRARGGREDHSAEDALRDANQFDQELRRAQMDVLQATQDLATDYVERTSIGIEILNAEKAAFDSEQRYQVALFKLTKGKEGQSDAQAAQLKVEFDKADQLKRQRLLDDEQLQRRQDVAMLDQTNFDMQKDKLQSELQLATTAKEQRDIQLKLLDLSYRQEQARLEAVIADEKASDAAKEDARRRIAGMKQTYGNDRQGVINNTMGPLESYLNGIPHTVDQTNEALQNLEVQGSTDSPMPSPMSGRGGSRCATLRSRPSRTSLPRLSKCSREDDLLAAQQARAAAVSEGRRHVRFGSVGCWRRPSLGALSEGPGFAKRRLGVFSIMGNAGTDRNILSLNGLPIAKVSQGERLNIGNDNRPDGRRELVHIHMSGPMTDAQARRTGNAGGGWLQFAEIARSRTKGMLADGTPCRAAHPQHRDRRRSNARAGLA